MKKRVSKKPVIKKWLVTTKMHPLFDASMLRLSLVGMMVTVVSVDGVA